jgi:aspartyl-tRNA(Asn)/glutamyl-tRNA(Gln) amidotransferase subunit A
MPNLDADLAFASASELRALIADRQITSTELTELYLSRIENLDGQLHSFLTVTPDIALDQAAKADAATARGESLGPLHGLPISIKDLQMTKGVRTTGGSLAYKDRVPDANAAYIDKIFDAGAVMLGKTNTPEFGHLGTSDNRLGPPCGNPWNPERTSGGSSGGAGASLAAGLCPLATGGDGGGSIRIPASFNGVYGIKPTQGRVSSYTGSDGPPMANLFSQQGPMSRTVADSALLLQVMAGYDGRDSSSMRESAPDFTAAVGIDIEGLKFGWSLGWGYAAVDSEVGETAEAGAKVFEELGCTVDESDIALQAPFETWYVLSAANAIATNGHLLEDHEDELTWYVRYGLEYGLKLNVTDFGRALGERDRMIQQFWNQFEQFDLLLSPTMATTAFPHEQYPEEIGGEPPTAVPWWGYLPHTHPINTIGFTAASVPCGFDSDGMPIGLHIVGKPGDEATVIAASAAFEEARPWAQLRPEVS